MMRHNSHRCRHTLLPAVFAVLISELLKAQAPGTGAIGGEVVDFSGAVIAGTHIVAVAKQTNARRSVSTALDGLFRILAPIRRHRGLPIRASTDTLIRLLSVLHLSLATGRGSEIAAWAFCEDQASGILTWHLSEALRSKSRTLFIFGLNSLISRTLLILDGRLLTLQLARRSG
jgi:hypothetical protein